MSMKKELIRFSERLTATDFLRPLSRVKTKLQKTDTNGWCTSIGLSKAFQKETGIYLDLFLDEFATHELATSTPSYSLYFGYSMPRRTFNRIHKERNSLWPTITDSSIAIRNGKTFLKKSIAQTFDFNVRYFEKYNRENKFWFGGYIKLRSFSTLKSPGLLKKVESFFNQTLSDPHLFNAALPKPKSSFDGAMEGYLVDFGKVAKRQIDYNLRRRALELASYRCQACDYSKKVNGKLVLDVHHTKPLALGRRLTTIKDLLVLCPCCHRIAHSRSTPLLLSEIKRSL